MAEIIDKVVFHFHEIQTFIMVPSPQITMSTITEDLVLEEVDHILVSGTGNLDFSVSGENSYYTWWGAEDSDWDVSDVDRVENVEEDRIILYPEAEFFTCEIEADGEEENTGPVRCHCG